MPDGTIKPIEKRDTFSAIISARWVPVLRPFMADDEAPGAERGWHIRGIQVEPHPVEGVTIMATNGWMMAVAWDRKGRVDKPIRVELPDCIMDACKPPKAPEIWNEGDRMKTPPMPDWMVPHRLWLCDIAAMVLPRDGGKIGLLQNVLIEESNCHNWGLDYRRHNKLVAWEGFRAAAPVPIAGMPPMANIVLRKLTESCEAISAGAGSMRFWSAGIPGSEELFVRFENVKNLVVIVMPRALEAMDPIPDWFPACAPLPDAAPTAAMHPAHAEAAASIDSTTVKES